MKTNIIIISDTDTHQLPEDSNKIFETKTSLELRNLGISSQGVDYLSTFGDNKGVILMFNCVVEDSINTSTKNGNKYKFYNSVLTTNKPIEITNIDNIIFDDVDINVILSENKTNFFSTYICKIESSDVFDFEALMNIVIEDQNVNTDLDYFVFNDSYVKHMDIECIDDYPNVGRSNLNISDDTNGYII